MNDIGSPKRDTETNTDHARVDTVSRRNILRQSAFLTATGIGGLSTSALVGTAAADGDCPTDPYDIDELDYAWDAGDDAVDINGCDTPYFSYGRKTTHSASILYFDSYYEGGEWIHLFSMGGHSEFYLSVTECDSWDHSAGIEAHKATIHNNNDLDNINPPNEADVAGLPAASSGNGTLDEEYAQKAAVTVISKAMGYYWGPWVGVASGVAMNLLLDSQSSDTENEDTRAHEWSYGSSAKMCASHYVDFDIEGTESVSLDVTDEVWSTYPGYAQVYAEIDFVEPDNTSNASISTSPGLTTRKNGSRRDVSPGDVIETTHGEPVRVKDVAVTTTQTPGQAPQMVSEADSLPRRIRSRLDSTGPVKYARFPAQVRTISITGDMLE